MAIHYRVIRELPHERQGLCTTSGKNNLYDIKDLPMSPYGYQLAKQVCMTTLYMSTRNLSPTELLPGKCIGLQPSVSIKRKKHHSRDFPQ